MMNGDEYSQGVSQTLAQGRQRRNKPRAAYDETSRRKPRMPRASRHVEHGRGPRAVTVIAVATKVVERIVSKRYVWQVANYRKDDSREGRTRRTTEWPLIWDDGG